MIGDCIETPHGAKDKDGYPRAKYQGRLESVSRTIMGLLYGRDVILGKTVCHTCNNRACVNPAHLYLGDPQTNSDDKHTDGTMSSGENHGRYRHDVDTDTIIHMYYNLGYSQDKIGAEFGISQSAVSGRIKRNKGDNR
jgi:hypothetical protein